MVSWLILVNMVLINVVGAKVAVPTWVSRLNDLAGYVDFFFADEGLGVGKTGLGGDNGLPFFS